MRVSIVLLVGSCVSRPGEHSVSSAVFPAVAQWLFRADSGFCTARLTPAETCRHRAGYELQALLLFPLMKNEKKAQYLHPCCLSHVRGGLHLRVSQPCYDSPWCAGCRRCSGTVPPLTVLFLVHAALHSSHRNRAPWKPSNICNLEARRMIRRSCWNGLKMFVLVTDSQTGRGSWHGCATTMRPRVNINGPAASCGGSSMCRGDRDAITAITGGEVLLWWCCHSRRTNIHIDVFDVSQNVVMCYIE